MPDSEQTKEQTTEQEEGRKLEKIGGVTLDLTRWPGEDYYSDGTSEDEILQIVKEKEPQEFDQVIREKNSWPVLYHLSPIRGNIVDWIPFQGTEKVLEIGAGEGAITTTLARRCGQVVCNDLSKKRSEINAYRNKDRDNITIHVGNFKDVEPDLDRDFDYIFLIGVLEYAGVYMGGSDPFRMELLRLLPHLKAGGRLVIAIENRLGLKYFAGCREDHTGRYFDGIESYADSTGEAKTFSRPGLEQILQSVGASEYSFYYPYPDYKFMETLYSDQRLPEASELSSNIRNFDRDRLLLFDEKKAYRGILSEGVYPLFANSYEIIVGPSLPVAYCKFSTDRDPGYQIRTDFRLLGRTGSVCKYPETEAAAAHVQRMSASCKGLKARYEAGNADPAHQLFIAPCRETMDGGVLFDFVPGLTLESLLDQALSAGDKKTFLALLSSYRDRVGYNSGAPISDYDCTFSNILIYNDTWTAIDYEWAVDEAIPVRDQLVRSLVCYVREDGKRKGALEKLIGRSELLSFLQVSEDEIEKLTAAEDAFQEHVTGGTMALGELRSKIGGEVIKPAELQTDAEKAAHLKKIHDEQVAKEKEERRRAREAVAVQVFFDTGKGYSEEESFIVDHDYETEGVNAFTIQVPANVKRLRIDPARVPCICLLRRADIDGNPSLMQNPKYRRVTPASSLGEGGAITFLDCDPWLDFDMVKIRKKLKDKDPQKANTVSLAIQIAGIPGTMADMVLSRRKRDR